MPMTTDKWQITLKLMRKGWTTALLSAQHGGFHSLSQRCGELTHKYADSLKAMGLTLQKKDVHTGDATIKAYRLVKVEGKQ